jgi:hypothetical protein
VDVDQLGGDDDVRLAAFGFLEAQDRRARDELVL